MNNIVKNMKIFALRVLENMFFLVVAGAALFFLWNVFLWLIRPELPDDIRDKFLKNSEIYAKDLVGFEIKEVCLIGPYGAPSFDEERGTNISSQVYADDGIHTIVFFPKDGKPKPIQWPRKHGDFGRTPQCIKGENVKIIKFDEFDKMKEKRTLGCQAGIDPGSPESEASYKQLENYKCYPYENTCIILSK